jgi:hypothetical protein
MVVEVADRSGPLTLFSTNHNYIFAVLTNQSRVLHPETDISTNQIRASSFNTVAPACVALKRAAAPHKIV